jgi:diaminopimelate decarboxylase
MRTKSMSVKDGILYVGEHSLVSLADKYKTPLYVYDEEGIEEKIKIFKDNFTSNKFKCEIVYASKAFIAPYLCKILEKAGFGIDAVSVGDLYLIEKSNFPMNRVILHGNNKSLEELNLGIDLGLEYIVVDSLAELIKLEQIASTKKKEVNTLFRINPGIHADTHAYIETSLLSSKFGESIHDDEILTRIMKIYNESQFLRLDGFHSHIGSQINNPKSFVAEVKTMLNFIKRFERKYKHKINTLNLGGGFGIKYLDDDKEINLELILKEIVKATEEGISKNNLSISKLMIEPGRAIVGDSGFTLYKCGSLKTTFAGKKYLFIDGGMSDNIRPALYQAKYTVEVANRIKPPLTDDEEYDNLLNFYDVVGKCCESGDVIALNVTINEVKKDDTIVVYSTGAYTYSMSMNYNGLTRGAVVFVKGAEVKEVIRRESLEDLVKTCNFEV